MSQTIVTNLEAPRLEGISVSDFNKFLRLRRLYEKKIKEKSREPVVSVTAVSYKASIDYKYLEMMIAAEWIKADTSEKITEQQLQDCVEERATRTVDETQIDNIQSAIKNVKMSTTGDAEDRVWTLYAKYIEVLESFGFKDLHKTHPHIAIKHIYNKIQPIQLKRRMKNIAQVKKSEKFDDANFNAYPRDLAKQYKKLGEEQRLDLVESSDSDSDVEPATPLNKKRKKKSKKRSTPEESGTGKDTPVTTPFKKQKSLPDCLNPTCHEKHWINNYPITGKMRRKTL